MTKKDDLYESEDPYLKWLKDIRKVSKTTVSLYNKYYEHFVKLDPTQENINKFLQKKKNNFVVRGFMKSFLEFLEIQDQFTIPPKPTGKKAKKIIRDFTQDQIKKVQKYSYINSLRDGLVFDLLYYGALREFELLTIQVNNFYWDDFLKDPSKYCRLFIIGKGKKQREVLISPGTMQKILNYYLTTKLITPEMEREDLINTLSSNKSFLFKNLYEWRIWKIIKTNSERSIGIAMRPHEIRHTRATDLEKQGVPIRAIQHYLGHANPRTTEIYLHIQEKQSLENVKSIVEN